MILTILILGACGNETGPEAAEQADFIYEDDFSADQAGRWITEGDELGSTTLDGERLVIDINAANTLQYSALSEPDFSDIDLRVNATLLDGGEDSTYGILFRMQGPDAFYRFEVMGDGHFMVERLNKDGSWKRFIEDWESSDAILPGLNSTNELRVVAVGPIISFYVNDELLIEVTDSAYPAGTIALDAGSFGIPKATVAFDNLTIAEP
jgi:hypothetical protein